MFWSADRTVIPEASGAHTGDISAEMLKDAGANAVIVGHSERRADHGELSSHREQKGGGGPSRRSDRHCLCIGETAGERAAGLTMTVVARQLSQSLPASCNDEQHRRRLRAGLGHWHWPDTDAGMMLPKCMPGFEDCSAKGLATAVSSAFSTAARSSPTTRRELMAVENVDGASGRGREPEGGRFSRHNSLLRALMRSGQ